ncbi:hypothetical protein [Klebsiella michiganensis]|uniref:hypothetical protein n=1 Tax=Klebsiella michiganensis TaxID=1134687 RepID=UPI001D0F32DD|nr:hypothetical protein [Klebsiella michiganensis]
MTKNQLTREENVQAVFDLKAGYTLGLADVEILKRVARMALAAMDSESWCLPLDYLQGHKDGLEWAAQLAEANHPETGDWLYDDPIELAKAIRKGPDMPPAQPAPVIPDFETVLKTWIMMCAATFVKANTYIRPARRYDACRAAMLQELQKSAGVSNNCRTCENVQDLQAGNSPAQGGSRCSIKAAPALDSSPKTAESRCGNSPVIPEGYVMVPKEPTAEMVKKMRYHVGGYDRNIKEGYKAMLAAAPQEVKGE